MVQSAPPELFTRIVREKEFELKDHLGNVRVVVSDLKLNGDPDNGASGSLTPQSGRAPYIADLLVYNNYYPFGMLQPDRHHSTEGHRYGFNGMEMDNEMHEEATTGTSGTGSNYDFGARMYDARLGRWSIADPQEFSSPSEATYIAFANNPLYFMDPDGEKVETYETVIDGRKVTVVKVTGSIINLSGDQAIDLEAVRDEMIEQGNALLNGSYSLPDGTEGEVMMEWDLRVVTNMSDVSHDDNLFVIADFLTRNGGLTAYNDRVSYIRQGRVTQYFGLSFLQSDKDAARTGIHEFLHMLDNPAETSKEIHGTGSIHGIERTKDEHGNYKEPASSVFHASWTPWDFTTKERGIFLRLAQGAENRDATNSQRSPLRNINSSPLDPGPIVPDLNVAEGIGEGGPYLDKDKTIEVAKKHQ